METGKISLNIEHVKLSLSRDKKEQIPLTIQNYMIKKAEEWGSVNETSLGKADEQSRSQHLAGGQGLEQSASLAEFIWSGDTYSHTSWGALKYPYKINNY